MDPRAMAPDPKPGSTDGPPSTRAPNWALALDLGIRMALTVGIGLGGGLLLDNWLKTLPIFTLIGMVLGISAAMVTIWNVARDAMRRQMPEEEAGGESLIHVAISAEEVFQIGPLVVTNSMIGALLASAILLLATWYISRRGSALIPGRLQGVIELPIELLAGIISASTSRWRSYAALILCFFLMILVANWIGLLPGVGTVGINHVEEGHEVLVPIVRPASADLNFTLGLAIISVVMFIYWGIRAHGVGGYLRELMGEPLYLAPLIFPINVISELSRLISLSMRLFGNVFAGEVLLATMLALTTFAAFVYPLALFIPGLFVGLEILFGFVQALVFALLSLTYISTAIAEHHEPGDASDHGETDTAHSSHPPAAEAATT